MKHMTNLSERLFSLALSTDYIGAHCQWCVEKSDKLKRCTACKMVVYCGAQCQKADWNEHKPECAAIKKHDGVADEGIRLVMRLGVKWARGEVDGEGTTRTLEGLEDHLDEFRMRAARWLDDYKQFAVKTIVGDEVVKKLYCKSAVNSFGVTNEFGKTIGIGLCLGLSGIDHSCRPVTRIAYRGRLAQMVPTTSTVPSTLATGHHSYIDELVPREERRKLLMDQYNFHCECAGCSDEARTTRMDGWACPRCGGCVGREEGADCESCSYSLREDHSSVCKLAVETALAGNSSLKRKDLSIDMRKGLAEKVLSVMDGSLFLLNVLRLPALRALYESAIEEKDLENAEKYGRLILAIHSEFQGEKDLALCHFKYGLAQVLKMRNQQKECRELLEPVREVFGKTFGASSQIYCNVEIMMK